MARGLGPDFDHVFLTGQMGPTHPEYERMVKMYGDSPEGKRILQARKEDETFLDGLEREGPAQLDQLIRHEGVNYTGSIEDRLAKIHAIRWHRKQQEQELLDGMSAEEKDMYLKDKNANQARETSARNQANRQSEREDVKHKLDKAKALKQRKDDYLSERAIRKEEHRQHEHDQAAQAAARTGNPLPPLESAKAPQSDAEKKKAEKAAQLRANLQNAKK